MRRPTSLVVDTSTTSSTPSTTPDASTAKLPLSPELPTSPASSVHSIPTNEQPPQPSIRLLFSLLSRRDLLLLVLPAIMTSMLSGGVAPFMTFVIGQAFDAFAQFPVTPNPPESAKHQLLHDVGLTAIELLALAIGALALSSLTSSLWIWTGERNLLAVRKHVYSAVTRKDMVWFDTKMGSEDSVQSVEGDGPLGAGGLMAKFARETDEVRMASSLASGMLIQYLTTTLTCLILAFTRSWALTLVILSAVPVLMFIQGLSQAFAGPHLQMERAHTASAATLVDRAVAAIATVKAFNAEMHEQGVLGTVLDHMQAAANRCVSVWGVTSGLSQFAMMAMFVQGFWFGAKLVRDGTISPGSVMAVFWACLIATSNLQMCIPQLIVIAKGKFAIAALFAVSHESSSTHRWSALTPLRTARRHRRLRKIVPRECKGGVELCDISFTYPSRPSIPVLRELSIFLPAGDMTFIVGGSGSGKSTIAQLLLRMYDVQDGMIRLDEQDMAYLDEDWTRENIAAVSQSCILFDMTVHENVAMGLASPGSRRRPEDITREEVVAVCRASLMHDFVRDLPDGYDTKLGNGGANLSGGQKQRLAIARALLRNPTILVLDEATSALDATSRLLVFEAIKQWRHNKTTIVITHDLSQIPDDLFVYVLKSGELVEQGFRCDLESVDGEFTRMLAVQGSAGGFPQTVEPEQGDIVEAILEQQDAAKEEELEAVGINSHTLKRQTFYRPITMGNWMFDAVADLAKPPSTATPPVVAPRESRRVSRFVPAEAFSKELASNLRRQSLHISVPAPPSPAATSVLSRRYSLQFTPVSPTFTSSSLFSSTMVADDAEFDDEKMTVTRSATRANLKRAPTSPSTRRVRAKWDESTLSALTEVKVESFETSEEETSIESPSKPFFRLMRDIYPTIPHKPLIFVGLLVCVASGVMTPLFSYLLSRLLFEVSIGAKNVSLINTYGGIVLAVAAADGLFIGLKYAIMETAAMSWVTRIRKTCFDLVLSQDKKWFDKTENSSVRLTQILIKDGDDARTLIATVLAQFVVVAAMLGVGLIWALVQGWQLTLVGFAIAPVFALTMAVQANLVAKCEVRNKRAREEIAKGYYDAISNVRGIRAMGFEGAFQEKFEQTVDQALSTGVRGAFVEGCTYGVASALIYLAEALLFYVGAILISRGTYDYLRMVQVLNLVVFTVTIGSQLMAFTQRIAKSVQATRDFDQLLSISKNTDESRGVLRPQILGNVSFNHVSFSYPERPDVPILKDLSLEIADSECVAIVGASGSGKSTIAALLQRLYEPASGSITIGLNKLRSTDVHHLRQHVSVVSQNPNLFDATIAENISYGNKNISVHEIQAAARAANVHDFIMSLPKGYDTLVGENASLISGGQAQRLQIARALARPAKILILDECTSALDAVNQAAVMETIRHARVGRTTIMVTHKPQVMRMCDRILVVDDGVVAERGTFGELVEKRGVFAQLASGGEWTN